MPIPTRAQRENGEGKTNGEEIMIRIGDKAPDFTLKGIFAGKVSDFGLQSFHGKWLILFFYPADFTFICPTEVAGFSKMASRFRAEDAEILGVSVDSIDSHRRWAEELGGVEYALLSDDEKTVSRAYDVLDEREGVCLRATFIINLAGDVFLSRYFHSGLMPKVLSG